MMLSKAILASKFKIGLNLCLF